MPERSRSGSHTGAGRLSLRLRPTATCRRFSATGPARGGDAGLLCGQRRQRHDEREREQGRRGRERIESTRGNKPVRIYRGPPAERAFRASLRTRNLRVQHAAAVVVLVVLDRGLRVQVCGVQVTWVAKRRGG